MSAIQSTGIAAATTSYNYGQATKKEEAHQDGHGHAPHWTHAEQSKWGSLAPEFGACDSGIQQSPINIVPKNAVYGGPSRLNTEYVRVPANVVNNGHTVQANFEAPAGTMSVDLWNRYTPAQIHMHKDSEHVIDGKKARIEAHIVHTSEQGKFAVLGFNVVADESARGSKADLAFKQMLASLSDKTNDPKSILGGLNPTDFLTESKAAYLYPGSLTTPPCSEGIAWNVLKEAVAVAPETLDALEKALGEHNNSRIARDPSIEQPVTSWE